MSRAVAFFLFTLVVVCVADPNFCLDINHPLSGGESLSWRLWYNTITLEISPLGTSNTSSSIVYHNIEGPVNVGSIGGYPFGIASYWVGTDRQLEFHGSGPYPSTNIDGFIDLTLPSGNGLPASNYDLVNIHSRLPIHCSLSGYDNMIVMSGNYQLYWTPQYGHCFNEGPIIIYEIGTGTPYTGTNYISQCNQPVCNTVVTPLLACEQNYGGNYTEFVQCVQLLYPNQTLTFQLDSASNTVKMNMTNPAYICALYGFNTAQTPRIDCAYSSSIPQQAACYVGNPGTTQVLHWNTNPSIDSNSWTAIGQVTTEFNALMKQKFGNTNFVTVSESSLFPTLTPT